MNVTRVHTPPKKQLKKRTQNEHHKSTYTTYRCLIQVSGAHFAAHDVVCGWRLAVPQIVQRGAAASRLAVVREMLLAVAAW
jgi:hypothetical protein